MAVTGGAVTGGAVVAVTGGAVGLREGLVAEVAGAVAANFGRSARRLGIRKEVQQEAVVAGLHCLRHDFQSTGYVAMACRYAIARQVKREKQHWKNRDEEFHLETQDASCLYKIEGVWRAPAQNRSAIDVPTRVALRTAMRFLSNDLRKITELRILGYSVEECANTLLLHPKEAERRLSAVRDVFREALA